MTYYNVHISATMQAVLWHRTSYAPLSSKWNSINKNSVGIKMSLLLALLPFLTRDRCAIWDDHKNSSSIDSIHETQHWGIGRTTGF